MTPDGPLRVPSEDELRELVDARSPRAEPEADRGRAAALLSPPRARADDRRRRSRRRCPARTSRSRTRSSARSASTSGRPRPRSTRRCRRCWRATCGAWSTGPRRASCPSRRSCNPTAGLIDLASAAGHAAWTVLSGPAAGAAGAAIRGASGRALRTRCASTWAAPPATSASSTTARCRSAARARSPIGRSRCRCSPSTRSAPAAARSPGAIRAARCAWGRARPGADPGPACYGRGGDRADRDRRKPAARLPAAPMHRWPAASSSIAAPPSAPWARWHSDLGLETAACARGDRPRRQRRDDPGAARRHRAARASTRGGMRCWRSAARGRCTRRRSPRSSASRRSSARGPRACSPRSGWSSRPGAETCSEACCCRGDSLSAVAVAELVAELGEQAREALGDPDASCRRCMSCATAGRRSSSPCRRD